MIGVHSIPTLHLRPWCRHLDQFLNHQSSQIPHLNHFGPTWWRLFSRLSSRKHQWEVLKYETFFPEQQWRHSTWLMKISPSGGQLWRSQTPGQMALGCRPRNFRCDFWAFRSTDMAESKGDRDFFICRPKLLRNIPRWVVKSDEVLRTALITDIYFNT